MTSSPDEGQEYPSERRTLGKSRCDVRGLANAVSHRGAGRLLPLAEKKSEIRSADHAVAVKVGIAVRASPSTEEHRKVGAVHVFVAVEV